MADVKALGGAFHLADAIPKTVLSPSVRAVPQGALMVPPVSIRILADQSHGIETRHGSQAHQRDAEYRSQACVTQGE